MKKIIILISFQFCLACLSSQQVVKQQVPLDGNNLTTFIWNTGVFNQDLRTNNTPGLEWPKGSGKFACFTAGLCIGGYVNNELRMGVASYNGEYCPGYSSNGQYFTDSRFRHYRVKRGDNYINNPDWLNWGLMVPFGAPYTDVNNNGYYEYFIDIPGFKGAAQTVFICMTDGNPANHTPSEGFGGGTAPLFATVGLTAWCYDTLVYRDMNFLKWDILNGGTQPWDSTIFSIYADNDLGDASDDYIGCDTSRYLGYCFNSDNMDGDGSGTSYGMNPPASGILFLNCNGSSSFSSSFSNINSTGSPGPLCERDATNSSEAYRYMKGFKKDETPWVNILSNQITKFCFPGDPESSVGWTPYNGRIENCGGLLTGTQTIPVPAGDRRFVMSYKPSNQPLPPGTSKVVLAAQIVARGSNNKNSVTLLKQLSDSAKGLCQNGFVIGINPISTEIPNKFSLHQNYPNPFNPLTKIKFDISKSGNVILKIYDALGREIATLVNEKLTAGVYSIDWDGINCPSGVYFYQLASDSYTETRKMALIK